MQAVGTKTGEKSIKPGPSGQDWDDMSGVNQKGRFAPSPGSQSKIAFQLNGFTKRGQLPKSGLSEPPDFSNDQDMTSASSDLKESSELPSSLRSKMTFRRKAFRGKEEMKLKKSSSSERPATNGVHELYSGFQDLKESRGFRSKLKSRWNGFHGKRGKTSMKSGLSVRATGGVDDLHSDFRDLKESLDHPRSLQSKLKSRWNGFHGKKDKTSMKSGFSARATEGVEDLHCGFRDLKETLDHPCSVRTKLKFRWNGFRGKRGKTSMKSGFSARATGGVEDLHSGFRGLRETLDHPRGLLSKVKFRWKGFPCKKDTKSTKSSLSGCRAAGGVEDLYSGFVI